MSTQQFKIIDGPPADRLIDSFKYAFSIGIRLYVEFRIEGNVGRRGRNVIEVQIKALAYESGNPDALLFEGDIREVVFPSQGADTTEDGISYGRIKGYYEAKGREGSFKMN